MSKKSGKSSKTRTKSKKLEQPFEASVLRRAKKVIADYRLTFERNDSLVFIGSSVELPTVFADGSTIDQCYKNTREALMVAVATMIECGQRPPQPSSAKKRTFQVNIRLSAEEKLLLANESVKRGFRGVSDFIRTSALEECIHSKVHFP